MQKDWIISKGKKSWAIITFLKWHAKQGHSGAAFYREWSPWIYTQPSYSSDIEVRRAIFKHTQTQETLYFEPLLRNLLREWTSFNQEMT